MSYERQFRLGRTYRSQAGKLVKIIATSVHCVQGDDGEGRWDTDFVRGADGEWVEVQKWFEGSCFGWRYDRESDAGRCTASAFDMSEPRNLIPGSWTPQSLAELGEFFKEKFTNSVKERGVYATAKNMRKQGIPISVVLSLLRIK